MWEENLGYIFTAEETALLRRKLIEHEIIPAIGLRFAKHPQLQSAALFVAQYWDDEAGDAVHQITAFSILETPDLNTVFSTGFGNNDPVNLPGFKNQWELDWGGTFQWLPWNDNGLAIPLFAAYCKEGADQNMAYEDAYSLFAIFRKTPDGIDVEYSGEMVRPWLEGTCPERCEDYAPDELQKLRAEWMASYGG